MGVATQEEIKRRTDKRNRAGIAVMSVLFSATLCLPNTITGSVV